MKKLLTNLDWRLFISLMILVVFGLMLVKSVAPEFFFHHLVNLFLGLIFFFLFAFFDYRFFSKLGHWLYLFSLIGLILTFIFGAVTRGSVRWVQLGNFVIQPSELAKPLLILAFAAFFISRPLVNFKDLFSHFLYLVLPVFLIFAQPDLGSSLVVVFFWLGMVFAAGLPKRSIVFGLFLVLFLLPLGWFILQPYQKARVISFLNPFADSLGAGYNLIQSMIAVGSGQFWGRGLGRGTQSHLRFLPERHTDFIFASLAEELGFLGSFFILLVYGFLLWHLLQIAKRSEDLFARLVCLGVFGMIFGQVFINVGMNLGLVPVAGLTLPLISSGGSSLIATMISLGLVANISQAKYNKGR